MSSRLFNMCKLGILPGLQTVCEAYKSVNSLTQ